MMTDAEAINVSDPGAVVASFIVAMNAWEIETAASHSRAKQTGSMADYNLPLLAEIFDRHCTVRDRPRGRLSAPSFQRPPEYDPRTETIVEVVEKDQRTANVETIRGAPLGGRYRYTLHRSRGQWRIDSVACLFGETWQKGTL